MSTSPQPTTDEPTPTTRTDRTTPFSSSSDPTETTGRIGPTQEPTTTSWVDRCQRQFTPANTSRLGNLADDANEAMPDGV